MKKTYRLVIDSDLANIDFTGLQMEVFSLLNSPIGWSKYGYEFVPVVKNEDIFIRISSPRTIRAMGGDGELSCAELNGKNMHLNAYRWLYGAPAAKLNLSGYRQYMVSHEMGHILGYQHIPIPEKGLAPIMIQQTLGIGNCIPNCELFI
jgi:hypothetical protein